MPALTLPHDQIDLALEGAMDFQHIVERQKINRVAEFDRSPSSLVWLVVD